MYISHHVWLSSIGSGAVVMVHWLADNDHSTKQEIITKMAYIYHRDMQRRTTSYNFSTNQLPNKRIIMRVGKIYKLSFTPKWKLNYNNRIYDWFQQVYLLIDLGFRVAHRYVCKQIHCGFQRLWKKSQKLPKKKKIHTRNRAQAVEVRPMNPSHSTICRTCTWGILNLLKV